jgi:hypothetical protein
MALLDTDVVVSLSSTKVTLDYPGKQPQPILSPQCQQLFPRFIE